MVVGGNISVLCTKWRDAATRHGGITIGSESEQFRLHRNGIAFHDLSFAELREAFVGLTQLLLLPGMNTIIDLDHFLLWAWSAEVLVGGEGPLSVRSQREVSELAATASRTALANVRAQTREAFDEARQVSKLLGPNAREFLGKAHIALPYLSFPLLEAVARRSCASFIDLNGRVLQPFPRRTGRPYAPGERCSNLGDLLSLLVGTVATPDLVADLKDLLDHIKTFGAATSTASPPDGYAVLFDWRNSSLHGEASLTTIGGTVFSAALLIAVHGIAADYEQHRTDALARAQRQVGMVFDGRWRPSPWSYYPPFV